MMSYADKRPSRQVIPSNWSLIDPNAVAKVKSTLRCMGDSANCLQKINAESQVAYFFFFLLVQDPLSHHCRSRITLAPELHESGRPRDLRPTLVSSVIIRRLQKELDRH